MRQTRSGIYVPGDGIDWPESDLDFTEEWDEATAIDQCVDFRRALKQIDSRLDLIYAKEGAKALKGNRWYIIRRNDNLPPQLWEIEDENGEYCEPDERHMRRFLEGDTARHPDLYRKFEQARVDRKLRAEKAIEDKSEEFRSKLGERLNHVFDGRIAVTGTMKAIAAGEKVRDKPPPPPPRQKKKKHRH